MNTEKVISRDNDYILHTYGRSQVVLAEGEGMTARDADGKSYLDFTSGIGVNSLGYCHPAWVRAVADQAATLQHTSNLYYTAPDGKLAKKLCRRTGLDAVFFGNSGAEANEGAIKCARKYSVDTYGESRRIPPTSAPSREILTTCPRATLPRWKRPPTRTPAPS